jgi:hypothetical protein
MYLITMAKRKDAICANHTKTATGCGVRRGVSTRHDRERRASMPATE